MQFFADFQGSCRREESKKTLSQEDLVLSTIEWDFNFRAQIWTRLALWPLNLNNLSRQSKAAAGTFRHSVFFWANVCWWNLGGGLLHCLISKLHVKLLHIKNLLKCHFWCQNQNWHDQQRGLGSTLMNLWCYYYWMDSWQIYVMTVVQKSDLSIVTALRKIISKVKLYCHSNDAPRLCNDSQKGEMISMGSLSKLCA